MSIYNFISRKTNNLIENLIKTHIFLFSCILDDGAFDGDFEVTDPKRALSSKLDPMLMLNAAMQRKKGFNKTMASPRRNIHALSPARQSGHSSPVHSSTMIASMDQTCSRNRLNFSPLRKSLF